MRTVEAQLEEVRAELEDPNYENAVSVLGGLLHPDATAEDVRAVAAIVRPEDFDNEPFRLVAEAIFAVGMNGRAGAYSEQLVLAELRDRGDRRVTAALLVDLRKVSSAATVEYFAQKIRHAADLRNLHLTYLDASYRAQRGEESPSAILADVDEKLTLHRKRMGGGGLQTEGLDALLARDLPLPAPIIDGRILDEGKLLVLVGPPGSAKTWILLQLAHGLARADEAWLGARIFGPVRVLLLFGEGGPAVLKARVSNILGALGPLPEGCGIEVWTPAEDSIDLLNEDDLVRLEATITAGEFGLVIVDPLADFHSGEEDNLTFRTITRALRAIMARTGVSFAVAHHPRKRGLFTKAGSGEEGRGGIALLGAADAWLTLEPDPEDQRQKTLHFAKLKDAAPPAPWGLEQTETGVVVFTGTRVRKAGDPKVSGPDLVEFLRENGPSTLREMCDEFGGVDRQTIYRAMGRLDDSSAIFKTGEKRGRAELYGLRSEVSP